MNGLWIYQQQRIYLSENSMLCYGPLVSELGGGQSAWCPNPVIAGGGCAPPASPAPPPMVLNNVADVAWTAQ